MLSLRNITAKRTVTAALNARIVFTLLAFPNFKAVINAARAITDDNPAITPIEAPLQLIVLLLTKKNQYTNVPIAETVNEIRVNVIGSIFGAIL